MTNPEPTIPWDGASIDALVEQYANGIYVANISKPPIEVCRQHMREFLARVDELRANEPKAESFSRAQLLRAVADARERFELAGQALIEGLIRENDKLRAALMPLADTE